ncbi:MAG: R3H domain-containing nucleic acid-binding protein [Thermomicrobiales bacterium]
MRTQMEPAVDFEEYEVTEHEVTDNLDDLLLVLPPRIRDGIRELTVDGSRGSLVEIVMDLGRKAEARFQDAEFDIGDEDVTREEIEYVAARIGQFGDDNRAGIERTLHRISAIRNRSGEVVGLTCRIGRAVYGTIAIIRDLVESGESLLLLGRPGVGKTTMLREVARVLADDLHRRVIVVDTSNEIAGDGDIPHPAIGRARRMQVATPTAQHGVMIEAVENHMPEVIVIDEIGTELEAGAARTIAERGVQLIGTAHGNTLENLMMNPTLSDLIGGIQSVTLSDEEARRRGTQKSILERKAPPSFTIMVELLGRDEVAVHRDVAQTVDAILRGAPVRPEVRRRAPDGTLDIESPEELRRSPAQPPVRPSTALTRGESAQGLGRAARPTLQLSDAVYERIDDVETPQQVYPAAPPSIGAFSFKGRGTPNKPVRIYPFGVSRNRLADAIEHLRVPAMIVRDPREADIVLTLKSYFRTKPQPIREAENRGTPVYVLRSNTLAQIEHALSALAPIPVESQDVVVPLTPQSASSSSEPQQRTSSSSSRKATGAGVAAALEETEDAIGAVIGGMHSIVLSPQTKYVRRLQHQLADRYNVGSRSKGKEPNRRVELYRESPF